MIGNPLLIPYESCDVTKCRKLVFAMPNYLFTQKLRKIPCKFPIRNPFDRNFSMNIIITAHTENTIKRIPNWKFTMNFS